MNEEFVFDQAFRETVEAWLKKFEKTPLVLFFSKVIRHDGVEYYEFNVGDIKELEELLDAISDHFAWDEKSIIVCVNYTLRRIDIIHFYFGEYYRILYK